MKTLDEAISVLDRATESLAEQVSEPYKSENDSLSLRQKLTCLTSYVNMLKVPISRRVSTSNQNSPSTIAHGVEGLAALYLATKNRGLLDT